MSLTMNWMTCMYIYILYHIYYVIIIFIYIYLYSQPTRGRFDLMVIDICQAVVMSDVQLSAAKPLALRPPAQWPEGRWGTTGWLGEVVASHDAMVMPFVARARLCTVSAAWYSILGTSLMISWTSQGSHHWSKHKLSSEWARYVPLDHFQTFFDFLSTRTKSRSGISKQETQETRTKWTHIRHIPGMYQA